MNQMLYTPVVDFHAHVYPRHIAERATTSLSRYTGFPTAGRGTIDHLLSRGREAGIRYFVLNSVATTAHQVSSINTFLAATVAANGNCYGLGTLHPGLTDEELDHEINRMISLGLRGVKLHPDNQRINADDPSMMRIYERLEGRLPVLMHCGDYRTDYSHPRRVAAVLDAFPKLTLVAAHFGGWSLFDYALEYLEDRNCYLDVSSTFPFVGPRRSRELIRIYGAERILFGSDYPVYDPVKAMEEFISLDLTDAENRLILYGNAMKILGEGC